MYKKIKELIGKNVRIVFKSTATVSEGLLESYDDGVLSFKERIYFNSLKVVDVEDKWRNVINYIDDSDILSICEIPSEAKSPSYKNILNTFREIEKELGFTLDEDGNITINSTKPINFTYDPNWLTKKDNLCSFAKDQINEYCKIFLESDNFERKYQETVPVAWKSKLIEAKMMVDRWDLITTDFILHVSQKDGILSELKERNQLSTFKNPEGTLIYKIWNAEIHFSNDCPQFSAIAVARKEDGSLQHPKNAVHVFPV